MQYSVATVCPPQGPAKPLKFSTVPSSSPAAESRRDCSRSNFQMGAVRAASVVFFSRSRSLGQVSIPQQLTTRSNIQTCRSLCVRENEIGERKREESPSPSPAKVGLCLRQSCELDGARTLVVIIAWLGSGSGDCRNCCAAKLRPWESRDTARRRDGETARACLTEGIGLIRLGIGARTRPRHQLCILLGEGRTRVTHDGEQVESHRQKESRPDSALEILHYGVALIGLATTLESASRDRSPETQLQFPIDGWTSIEAKLDVAGPWAEPRTPGKSPAQSGSIET